MSTALLTATSQDEAGVQTCIHTVYSCRRIFGIGGGCDSQPDLTPLVFFLVGVILLGTYRYQRLKSQLKLERKLANDQSVQLQYILWSTEIKLGSREQSIRYCSSHGCRNCFEICANIYAESNSWTLQPQPQPPAPVQYGDCVVYIDNRPIYRRNEEEVLQARAKIFPSPPAKSKTERDSPSGRPMSDILAGRAVRKQFT